jgi:hypothetical protein
MLFERSHAAEDAVMHKTRKIPLHRFLDIGACGMNHPAKMPQDWLGTVLG